MIICPVCDGEGQLYPDEEHDPESYSCECWRCDGDGWIFDDDEDEDYGRGDSLVPESRPPTGGQTWAVPETEPTELETKP